MKFRNIIVIFCVCWIGLIFVSFLMESSFVNTAAQSVNTTVALAADMALSMAQNSDEFFTGGLEAYDLTDSTAQGRAINGSTVLVNTGSKYVPQNVYTTVAEKVWNIDGFKNVNSNRGGAIDDIQVDTIYQYLYGIGYKGREIEQSGSGGVATDKWNIKFPFRDYLLKFGSLSASRGTTPIMSQVFYVEEVGGDYVMRVGYIPQLIRMGYDLISEFVSSGLNSEVLGVRKSQGTGLSGIYAYGVTLTDNELGKKVTTTIRINDPTDPTAGHTRDFVPAWNGYATYKKQSVIFGTGITHYTTPLSLGMTYLDNDILSYLFIENMDLLMRAGYITNTGTTGDTYTLGKDENGNIMGTGLVDTGLYDSDLPDSISTIENKYNIINNGIFSFVKGTEDGGTYATSADSSEVSTSTKIEYMVVDMFNADKNADVDAILKQIFGASTGVFKGNGAKGAYLQSISTDVDAETGGKLTRKHIVVAKVTFYADVIVPYRTVVFRDFTTKYTATGADADTRAADSTQNLLNMYYTKKDAADSRVSSVTGNTMYQYTTYFAVAP